MRGRDDQQLDVFSYVSPEQRVPEDHPLRFLRAMTDEALRELQPRFNKLYAKTGRPSIAPEKLLRALLLQALYSVRSERMLMEQLDYNLLFRWFVGLNMDDAIWDVTVFTKNRERLLDGNIARAFFQAVLQQARERSLLSDEHFTVDGTLLEAWASVKSYQRKDGKPTAPPDDPGNATVDFHREKRSNQTHASKTDPDAKMARKGKGKEAKLSYNANLLVENRNGLIVNTEVFEANGTAERDAALVMLQDEEEIQSQLGTLLNQASELREETVPSEAHFDAWVSRYDGWREEVLDTLGNFGLAADYALFQNADTMTEEITEFPVEWKRQVGVYDQKLKSHMHALAGIIRTRPKISFPV